MTGKVGFCYIPYVGSAGGGGVGREMEVVGKVSSYDRDVCTSVCVCHIDTASAIMNALNI